MPSLSPTPSWVAEPYALKLKQKSMLWRNWAICFKGTKSSKSDTGTIEKSLHCFGKSCECWRREFYFPLSNLKWDQQSTSCPCYTELSHLFHSGNRLGKSDKQQSAYLYESNLNSAFANMNRKPRSSDMWGRPAAPKKRIKLNEQNWPQRKQK